MSLFFKYNIFSYFANKQSPWTIVNNLFFTAVTTTQAPTTTTTQPPNEVCSSGTVQLTANNDTQLIQSPSYPIFYSPWVLRYLIRFELNG